VVEGRRQVATAATVTELEVTATLAKCDGGRQLVSSEVIRIIGRLDCMFVSLTLRNVHETQETYHESRSALRKNQ